MPFALRGGSQEIVDWFPVMLSATRSSTELLGRSGLVAKATGRLGGPRKKPPFVPYVVARSTTLYVEYLSTSNVSHVN